MGLVHASGRMSAANGEGVTLNFLVDTGSFYTAISPSVRERLGLPPGYATQTMIADGSIVDTEVVLARIHLLDREGVVPVEIMEVPEPLLGVSALEALGLKVNPVEKTLEHSRTYGPPPSFTRAGQQHANPQITDVLAGRIGRYMPCWVEPRLTQR